jgi:6-pyruvoyltetrahydropterin/6-carboxytetrahydropterin synthase
MFEVSISGSFSAAHHLAGYQGKCEAAHGHNWDVDVRVRGESLDEIGILLDFRDLKKHLRDVLETVDHRDLNELDLFKDRNPTSENIAQFLCERLAARIDCSRYVVHSVSVHETRGCVATYWSGKGTD